ncbi:putative ATP-dependent hsl protease ATP-binding subunit hslU [Cardiosporidium cionae]|uniref:ATP-dependent hsl protease ATP-binding subunit hslU n=1 Tax=Cardiosporidium cionae TaxID=476202 RepID=A0ABQ7JCN8_9APIC|nr:putative ATP-dependent hsl protease ATP-binding subunit hslU [Cardiosporidium cionae]|eukprot:KAF8821654.1 putative ATP-dependent hsl protease ATP-binding subunit hslU [Cardiosporidium cionae]
MLRLEMLSQRIIKRVRWSPSFQDTQPLCSLGAVFPVMPLFQTFVDAPLESKIDRRLFCSGKSYSKKIPYLPDFHSSDAFTFQQGRDLDTAKDVDAPIDVDENDGKNDIFGQYGAPRDLTVRARTSEQDNVLEKMNSILIPQTIVEELDKHIIGQDEAKRSLAVALRDRWRRWRIQDSQLRSEITPNNILLIGPSGCGKTELAKRLAAFAAAPFVKVVATKYTEVGFVGDDTHSMVHDLAEQALEDERKQQRKKVELDARNKAYIYLSSCIRRLEAFKDWEESFILEHLKIGRLDELEVEVDADLVKKEEPPSNPIANLINSLDGSGRSGNSRIQPLGMTISAVPYGDFSSIMNTMLGGGKKKNSKDIHYRCITIKEALPLLEETFANQMINNEDVYEAARLAAEQRGIIFIDEFDKIVDPKEGSEFRSKRRGVQKELLSLIEGTTVSTKIGRVSTDHVLFVASGSFNLTKPSEIMPELLGRLPIRCELKPLTEEDLALILTDTRFNLLMQQQALLQTEAVKLEFAEGVVEEIAHIAYRLNTLSANVGARRLKTVLAKILEDIKFDAPKNAGKTIVITPSLVKSQLTPLLQQADLSKYIL